MRNIRAEVFLWVNVLLVAGLWASAIFFFSPTPKVGWHSIKLLPEVVTTYGVIALLFTQVAWRWPIFAGWLVPFPDLEGTWRGRIKPSGSEVRTDIAAILVIRQDFRTIRCTVFTAESVSTSMAASFELIEDTDEPRLTYVYFNRPRTSVRDRSAMHDGAAALAYSAETKQLTGEYWTSRKTVGELHFVFEARKRLTTFSP
ncbi:MAG: hypothetical protein ACREMS_06840 [Gemmatimonadaceae bacterium]